MSIDLNWDTLTGGPDGTDLAERIRDFIHTKFQSVPLPRFIKSVTVHDFEFGNIPPEVVLKDICDPLPDFYEENPDLDEDEEEDGNENGREDGGVEEDIPDAIRAAERRRRADQSRRLDGGGRFGGGVGAQTPPVNDSFFPPHIHTAGLRSAPQTPDHNSPFRGLGASTPGIPGGTSNMHYFQSKLGAGWSGTQTPLAAVAGAQHLHSWLDMGTPQWPPPERSANQRVDSGRSPRHDRSRNLSQGSISVTDFPASLSPTTAQSHSQSQSQSQSQVDAQPSQQTQTPHPLQEKHSISTLAPTSAETSRPPTRDAKGGAQARGSAANNEKMGYGDDGDVAGNGAGDESPRKYYEPRVDDLQAVFRIRYAGDVKLMLTAEILLDYPMPSFVGIPVKLNITGLTFDGVGVVANIRKRVHFCFLSPDDALAAVGDDDDDDDDDDDGDGSEEARGRGGSGSGSCKKNKQRSSNGRLGGLLQEIRVESEIGQREGTRQSLKNVGKVEKFVLEQVRRIFEEEFVYPSFWTFLV